MHQKSLLFWSFSLPFSKILKGKAKKILHSYVLCQFGLPIYQTVQTNADDTDAAQNGVTQSDSRRRVTRYAAENIVLSCQLLFWLEKWSQNQTTAAYDSSIQERSEEICFLSEN